MSTDEQLSMFDPLYFLREVSKEVVHQVTGYEFEEKREKSPQEICNEAYNEAIASAYEQQAEIEQERA